jgi:hypothetical protein
VGAVAARAVDADVIDLVVADTPERAGKGDLGASGEIEG